MFQRISPIEPGIEHSVGKNVVGGARFVQCTPDAEALEIPNSVDDHRVESGPLRTHPGDKPRRVSVTAASWPKRMDPTWKIFHPACIRRVETGNLDLVSTPGQDKGRLPYRFERSANRRIKRMNATQDLHPDDAPSGCA